MAKRKFRNKCPCCGHDLAEPVAITNGEMVHLSANEQALFNLVKSCRETGISARAILERIWHTNKNGDPYCHQMVPTVALHTNKKIAAWGMKIVGTGGPGSVYRLVQL